MSKESRAPCAVRTAQGAGELEKNMKLLLTTKLIWAAATDAANRQMRRAGRTSWSKADLRKAVLTFNRLLK